MAKCSFCGKNIPKGTGKMFVKKEGIVLFFCSSKCENNQLKLGRSPHKKKWTQTWHQQKQFVQKAAKEKKGKEKGDKAK